GTAVQNDGRLATRIAAGLPVDEVAVTHLQHPVLVRFAPRIQIGHSQKPQTYSWTAQFGVEPVTPSASSSAISSSDSPSNSRNTYPLCSPKASARRPTG